MLLLPLIAAAQLAVAPSLGSALVFMDDYTAPRNAVVDAAGAKVVRVHALAGELKIRGRDGLTKVDVHGTARASNEDYLRDITLTAERHGDVVDVRVDIPERTFVGIGRFYRALDLDIDVPAGVALEVEDSSGDLEIADVGALDLDDSSGDITLEHVGGTLRVEDSSGDMRIDGVKGDVSLRDSSGGIDVARVVGSVTVTEDSSGEIEMHDISGTVHIERDSSGGISVHDIGGDFVVDRDGSGGIDYRGVKGTVQIPSRRHRG